MSKQKCRTIATVVGMSLAALCHHSLCSADDASDKTLLERWRAFYQATAESLEMRRDQVELALHPHPVLSYTNPVRRDQQHGAVFLWSEDGRPAVIGSIWSTVNRMNSDIRNVAYEWHSLAEDDVRAARDKDELWTSGEPGLTWQRTEFTPPAATRAARLVQMRDLARGFRAVIHSNESELRLMPQPLYRYPDDVPSAIDGAVFAYVMGTDPELFLVVEGRKEKDAAAWFVGFARLTNVPLTVKEGERTLWTCDQATPNQRRGSYYLNWKAGQFPANLPKDAIPMPGRTQDSTAKDR